MQARMPLAFLATWARYWLMFSQASTNTPQVHFLYTVSQPLCPKPVALPGVIAAKVQDPAFGLVESHPIGFSPAIQPVQIPLQGLATVLEKN